MLITVNEIKQHLRVEHTEEDTLISVYLDGAVGFVETYLKRPVLDTHMDTDTTWVVPEEIRIAIYMLTTHFYENRSLMFFGTIGQELKFSTKALLSPHRYRGV